MELSSYRITKIEVVPVLYDGISFAIPTILFEGNSKAIEYDLDPEP